MKTVRPAMSARHIVRGMDGKLRQIKKKDLDMEIHPGVIKAFRIICRIHINRILRTELSRKMASVGEHEPKINIKISNKKRLKIKRLGLLVIVLASPRGRVKDHRCSKELLITCKGLIL